MKAMLKNRSTLLLIGLLVLAFGLRLAAALAAPLTYDEAFSILISGEGAQGIITATLSMDEPSLSADIHPPAYYLLLNGWMRLFGNGVMAARLLSILLGMAGLFCLYLLIKELINEQTALWAGLIMALLPFEVHYATDIRMYSLLQALLLLATLAFVKGLKGRTWVWWPLFALSAAAAQYTHNLAAFYLVPLAATALFKRDKKAVRNTLLAGLGALLLYTPWLIHIPAQFSKVQAHYWIERPTLVAFVDLLLRFTTNLPLPSAWLLPGMLVAFLAVALPAYQTIKAARQKLPGYRAGLWLAWMSILPPLSLWLFSQWTPVYVERGLLASHALFCAWLAWALARSGMPRAIRFVVAGLLVFAAGLGLQQLLTNNGYGGDPLKAITAEIQAGLQPGDRVVHSNKLSYLPMFYFDPTLPMNYVTDVPGGSTDTLSVSTRRVLGLNAADDIRSALEGSDRVWFVIYQKSIDEYLEAGYETHADLIYLSQHYRLLGQSDFGGILLVEFEKAAQ